MKKLILCVLSVASIVAFAASEVWVAEDGNDTTGDGTKGNPYATIATGVANCDAGGTVWVKKGTYLLTAEIALNKVITVRSVDGADETIISGGMTITYTNKGDPNNYTEGVRVFNITAAATVDGFTIENGFCKSTGGAGIYMDKAGTVQNCVIRSCNASGNCSGGGVWMSSGTVRNCHIVGNMTWQDGGQGAGVYMKGADCVVEDCLIERNFHKTVNRVSKAGAGVRVNNGVLRRSTIVGNNFLPGTGASQAEAGGVYLDGNGKMHDCIVWGNGCSENYTAGLPDWGYSGSPKVTNVFSSVALGVNTSGRVLSGDPGFVDFAGGDYRLAPGSPCAGAAWGVAGGSIGCMNYDPDIAAVGIGISEVGDFDEERELTFTVEKGTGASSVADCCWSFDGRIPTASDNDGTGESVTKTFGPGVYTVTLAATVNGKPQVVVRTDAFRVMGAEITLDEGMDIYKAVKCVADGGTVNVPYGIYSVMQEIVVNRPMTIKGADGQELPVFRSNLATCRIFNLRHTGAVLERLAITGGKANHTGSVYGGGIFMTGGTVRECAITNNVSGGNGWGGGIAMTGGTVTHCLIADNWTSDDQGNGAGVYMEGPTALLDNCLVCRNHNNTNRETKAKYGGGVYAGVETKKIGDGNYGGTIRSCTIVNNTYPYAAGLYLGAKGSVVDTIVWGNTHTSADQATGEPNWLAVNGCKATNCFSSVSLGVDRFGEAMAYGDPLFEDFAAENYRLTSGVCVDSAWRTPDEGELDFDGNARLSGPRMDLGCYELDQNQLAFAMAYELSGTMAPVAMKLTMTVTPEGTDVSSAKCYWTLDGREATEEDYDYEGQAVNETIGAGTRSVNMAVHYNGKWYRRSYEKLFTVLSPVLFVAAESAAPSAPYDTWATAAVNVEDVLPLAGDGTLISVSNGTYHLTKQMDIGNKVTIRGVNGATVTKICGYTDVRLETGFRVANVQHKDAVLEGLTLADGYGGQGGCIYMSAGLVRNCIVTNGWSGGDIGGGGAYLTGGRLENVLITDCRIGSYSGRGCGLWIEGEGTVADRCVITRCFDSSPNANNRLGAVYIIGKGELRNSLVCNNRVKGCAGVYLGPLEDDMHAPTIDPGSMINCTVVSNAAHDAQAKGFCGGVHVGTGTVAAKVVNCAIANNVNEKVALDEKANNFSGNESGVSHCAAPVAIGSDAVSGDLGFVDAEGFDWHLKVQSPCRNRGLKEPWMSSATDLDGNPRVFGGRVDIGCYENQTPMGLLLMVR